MSKNNEEIYYLVPQNVKTRFQLFPGFGWHEILFIAAGALIGFLIYLFLGIFTSSLKRIFCIVFFIAISFALISPDPKTGTSLLNLVKDYKRFKLEQKLYLYAYGRGRWNEKIK